MSAISSERCESPEKRKRIFVIEDDPLMSLLLHDMLEAFGYEVAAIPAYIEDALKILEVENFDAGIVDINIQGIPAYEIADALRGKGIPFVFSTGAHPRSLPIEYQEYITLQKPYRLDELKTYMEEMFSTAPSKLA